MDFLIPFAWICKQSFASAWCPLFQLAVDTHSIPAQQTRTITIPVPKKPCLKVNNDHRPAVLFVGAYYYRLLNKQVQRLWDPYQFAYSDGRRTDDALSTTSHLIQKYLNNSKVYVQFLFIDFSSSFNTILPATLLNKLQDTVWRGTHIWLDGTRPS